VPPAAGGATCASRDAKGCAGGGDKNSSSLGGRIPVQNYENTKNGGVGKNQGGGGGQANNDNSNKGGGRKPPQNGTVGGASSAGGNQTDQLKMTSGLMCGRMPPQLGMRRNMMDGRLPPQPGMRTLPPIMFVLMPSCDGIPPPMMFGLMASCGGILQHIGRQPSSTDPAGSPCCRHHRTCHSAAAFYRRHCSPGHLNHPSSFHGHHCCHSSRSALGSHSRECHCSCRLLLHHLSHPRQQPAAWPLASSSSWVVEDVLVVAIVFEIFIVLKLVLREVELDSPKVFGWSDGGRCICQECWHLLLKLVHLLWRRMWHHHLCIIITSISPTGGSAASSAILVIAISVLGLAVATGMFQLVVSSTSKLEVLVLAHQPRLGAPQRGRLAGLVQHLDHGVRIHQTRHPHLSLLGVDAALVHTCRLVQTYILSPRLENKNRNG
jgi:hypothetical protein